VPILPKQTLTAKSIESILKNRVPGWIGSKSCTRSFAARNLSSRLDEGPEVGTQKSNPVRSTFAPLAMLPAWYATDEGLIVQDWNDFDADLLLFFKKEYLLPDRYLSIALDPPVEKGYESLWRCILDCSAETLHLIGDALRILAEHRKILDRFNQEEGDGGVTSWPAILHRLQAFLASLASRTDRQTLNTARQSCARR